MTVPVPMPATTTTTSPAGSDRILNVGELKWVAKQAGFPDSELATAAAVALAESGGRLNAFNDKPPDLSYGLWQINMIGDLGPARRAEFGISNNEALFGYANNAKAALKIWQGKNGWRNWTTYTSGKYRAFIAAAVLASPTDPGILAGETNTVSRIPDLFTEAIMWVLKQLSPVLLRVGGFVGGGILVIVAIVLYVRGQK